TRSKLTTRYYPHGERVTDLLVSPLIELNDLTKLKANILLLFRSRFENETSRIKATRGDFHLDRPKSNPCALRAAPMTLRKKKIRNPRDQHLAAPGAILLTRVIT